MKAKEMLAKAYVPPCELSVEGSTNGRRFGRLYKADDGSKHFKFNVTVATPGVSPETREVDIALTGKNSVQNVKLPPGSLRCPSPPPYPRWDCSTMSFGKDISCYQKDIRYGRHPERISFKQRGDSGECDSLAGSLNQMQTLLQVAACEVPQPTPPEPVAAPPPAEVVTEDQLKCAALAAHPTTGPGKSYILCLAERGIQNDEECCERVGSFYRERTRRDNERIQKWKDTIRRVVPGGGNDSTGAAPK